MAFLSDPIGRANEITRTMNSYFVDPNSLMCTDPAADEQITKLVRKDITKVTAGVQSSSTVAMCPLLVNQPVTTSKYDPENKNCNFKSLKVSKPGRKFDLIVTPESSPENRSLAIIGGFKDKPAKISAELQGPVGPCKETHNNKRSFNTGSSSLKILDGTTDEKLEFEVSSSSRIKIFPWGIYPNHFAVTANRCGHTHESANIDVYPDTEADISVTWNFGEKDITKDTRTRIAQKKAGKSFAKKNIGKEGTTTTKTKTIKISKGLEISGSIKYDGKERDLEITFQKTIETLKKIDTIVHKANRALSLIKSGKEIAESSMIFDNPVSFGLKLPNVGLGIGMAWIEDEGKPTVSYQASIMIVADPIIGISLEWNITDTILQAAPGGIAVKKILKKLKMGILQLVLKASAEVTGNADIDIINWKVVNVSGKIEGKIPVSAELTAIKFDFDVYIAHATIEAKIGVESGFLISLNYESSTEIFLCKGGFLNFVVWVSGMIEGGIGENDSDENTVYNKIVENGESSYTGSGKFEAILYEKKFEDSAKELFSYNFKEQ